MSQCFFDSQWIGNCTYREGLAHQAQAHAHVRRTGDGRLLGFSYDPVVTLGVRSDRSKDLVNLHSSTEVIEVDRGGEATQHSPGQLVIYPVIPLRDWRLGVREFVQLLENTSLRFFNQFAVEGYTKGNEPGLYTHKGKIAFFGIRVTQGVTTHGLSINVFNDLELFEQIRSCGKDSESFDRLMDYGVNAPLKVLFSLWSQCFQNSFSLTHMSREINVASL